ncbi:MAG: ATP-binding protein [Parvularcula sp.]|jgi:PAS domain S-box-containing protein|nr:ATP-binding protein [Parvularcula sp.]
MTTSISLRDDEHDRLTLLRSYEILDTARDPSFDRMTRLASKITGAEIAAVSLVDEHRQWFKASCGLAVRETPREVAFCSHALLQPTPLIVPDATRDPRFAENPLVTGELSIRTYIGIPLLAAEGLPLGTLCVIFRQVTEVDENHVELLRELAASTMDLLDAHRMRRAARAEADMLKTLRTDLQLQLDLMDSMSKATKTGGWCVDVKTRALTWTDETFRIHGFEPGPMPTVERAINAYVEDDRPMVDELVRRCIEGAKPFEMEHRLQMADGSHKWVRSVGSPRLDPEGNVIQIYGAFQDISEEKKRRDELIMQRQEAEAANRAKDDFLASMSHEIRTPMNGILGMLELTQIDELSPAQRQRVRIAYQSAEALLTLLNDVIDYAKIQAGSVELVSDPFEIRKVVASAAGLFAPSVHDKGLSLEVEISEDVPQAIGGDSVRIRQILTNFLSNALKFTDEGGITVSIERRGTPSAPLLYAAVKDTGIGIPEGMQDRLFQRFTQVDMSLSRRHAGAGLGLAICRELVGAMGGEIGVKSAEGEGATFWFTVPMRAADNMTSESEHPFGLPSGEGRRILLVEDNPVNRMVVEAMCQAAGHSVITASDGCEAIEAFKPGQFDAVLMDMQMPNMDGVEATRQIRRLYPDDATPIIALTANALRSHRQLCLDAGMDLFLNKPIKMNALGEALQSVMTDIQPARITKTG